MNISKFTQKSIEAVQYPGEGRISSSVNQEIEEEHLLYGLVPSGRQSDSQS